MYSLFDNAIVLLENDVHKNIFELLPCCINDQAIKVILCRYKKMILLQLKFSFPLGNRIEIFFTCLSVNCIQKTFLLPKLNVFLL